MNFQQFYRCMCRNRSGIASGRLFRGLQSFANPNLPIGTTDGGNACVLFARYGEGGTEVVGPIFFGK